MGQSLKIGTCGSHPLSEFPSSSEVEAEMAREHREANAVDEEGEFVDLFVASNKGFEFLPTKGEMLQCCARAPCFFLGLVMGQPVGMGRGLKINNWARLAAFSLEPRVISIQKSMGQGVHRVNITQALGKHCLLLGWVETVENKWQRLRKMQGVPLD